MSSDPIPSRLANLPGYDTAAPDIYETTDDTTSMLTTRTSPPLPSDPSDTSDDDSVDGDAGSDEQEGLGILSRRRLYPDRARRRFGEESRGLGSRGVDLSDRVDGKRKGYRVRRRSADVGVEGLQARIARLRREVEEVRVLAERERDAEGGAEEAEEDDDNGKEGQAEELGRLLAGVEAPGAGVQRRGKLVRSSSGTPGAWPGEDGDQESEEQTLRKVADFDTRLSALEQALGIQSLFDSTNVNAVSTPLLPTLTLLDQQLAALSSSTSLTNLEAASARITKLRSQAEAASSRPTSSSNDSELSGLTSEEVTKLQNLYTLLPTLQSLSPIVPALLTRLHSLRTLHSSAANAGSELEEVEKRQTEMETELKAWREGLEKVEQAVVEASEANGRNGKVVEGWVRELEGRMKKLGR